MTPEDIERLCRLARVEITPAEIDDVSAKLSSIVAMVGELQAVDTKGVVGGHALAMWWIPCGERPTVAEAKERLSAIVANGPHERAFTFKHRFPPPA